MLQPFGQDPQGQSLRFSHGFLSSLAVREYARQLGDFRKPTAVVFLFVFNADVHD